MMVQTREVEECHEEEVLRTLDNVSLCAPVEMPRW
jgi:hypothetical protein